MLCNVRYLLTIVAIVVSPSFFKSVDGSKHQIKVLKPESGQIALASGGRSSAKIIWQYSLGARRKDTKFFCGYHNKNNKFVVLAIDFDGKEFNIPINIEGSPKDDHKLISRVQNTYAENDGDKAKRGLTLVNLNAKDAETLECGFHMKKGAGIIYKGQITMQPSIKVSSRIVKKRKKSSSIVPWMFCIAIGVPVVIFIAGIFVFVVYKGRRYREAMSSDDRESLLNDVRSTDAEDDDDENDVIEFDKQRLLGNKK